MKTLRAQTAGGMPKLLSAINGISILTSIGAVVAALATTVLLLLATGSNPIDAINAIAQGSISSPYAISSSIEKAVPRLLAALGIALALRAGLYNIGAEGQIYIGGIAAAYVAVISGLTGPGALILALIAAFAAGAFWGAIPGVLRVKRGVSEVITSLMLVYIAIRLTNYILEEHWIVAGSTYPATDIVPPSTALPIIWQDTVLNLGAIIAVACVPLMAFLMRRTTFGLRLSAIGGNVRAAAASGTNVGRNMVYAMAFSGGLAGLAGAMEVVGVRGQLLEGFSNNYGFDAIAIALLGRLNPYGILAAALLFGALDAGGTGLQATGGADLPAGIVPTVLGFAMIYVLIGLGASRVLASRRRARTLLDQADNSPGPSDDPAPQKVAA
ncbi:MAG: ral nucleoside transport system permease protein [Thermoleophilales bacterium]|nr:ral nucleoside transport system permease protein [Thermoleophilales bacterium]